MTTKPQELAKICSWLVAAALSFVLLWMSIASEILNS